MKKALMALFLLVTIPVLAQTAPLSGTCTLGGVKASTSGMPSSNYLSGVVPSCTVTVYTGTTTLATIYADGNNTPLANPFTANDATSTNPGGWLFYAAQNSAYDVVLSGGISPNTYPLPVTIPGLVPCAAGSSCAVAVRASPAGTNLQIQYNNNGTLAGSQATVDASGNIDTPGTVESSANIDQNGIQIAPASPVQAIAAYDMKGTSSTQVTDLSGNGNNCVFGATTHAPTLANGALTFVPSSQQYCDTGIPMSQTQTIIMKVNQRIPAPTGNGYLNTLWASTDNSCTVFGSFINFNTPWPTGGYIQDQNATTGSVEALLPVAGSTVVALVRDATADKLYVNGVLSTWKATAISSTNCTTGNLRIGSNLSNVKYALQGEISGVEVFSTALNATQVQQATSALIASDAAKKYVAAPQVTGTGPQIVTYLDSRSYGVNTGIPYSTYMTTGGGGPFAGWNIYTIGEPGQRICDAAQRTDIPNAFYNPQGAANGIIVWGIVNDALAGTSLAPIEGCYTQVVKALVAKGWNVFVATEADASSPANWAFTFKNPFKTWLVANWRGLGAVGIVDLTADPNIGCDGCSANLTYFAADGIHMTVAGYQAVAAIAANVSYDYYTNSGGGIFPTGVNLMELDLGTSGGTITKNDRSSNVTVWDSSGRPTHATTHYFKGSASSFVGNSVFPEYITGGPYGQINAAGIDASTVPGFRIRGVSLDGSLTQNWLLCAYDTGPLAACSLPAYTHLGGFTNFPSLKAISGGTQVVEITNNNTSATTTLLVVGNTRLTGQTSKSSGLCTDSGGNVTACTTVPTYSGTPTVGAGVCWKTATQLGTCTAGTWPNCTTCN